MLKFKYHTLAKTFAILLLSLVFFSCDSKKNQQSATGNELDIFNGNHGESVISPASVVFASFISEYSGGLQTRTTPITIKLSTPVNHASLSKKTNDKLFNLEPSVKGQVKWVDDFTVQFVPENGMFNFGENVKVRFNLDELFANAKGLGAFEFKFYTYPAAWAVNLSDVSLTKGEAHELDYTFSVALSDTIQTKLLENTISITHDNKKVAFELFPLGKFKYDLKVNNIKKGVLSSSLVLNFDGKEIGFPKELLLTQEVPNQLEHKLMLIRSNDEVNNRFDFIFSQELNNRFDSSALLVTDTVSNSNRSYSYSVSSNKLLVYLKDNKTQGVFNLSKAIYSANAQPLSSVGTYPIHTTANGKITPMVKITSNGSILPDSKKQILTFNASALKCVDLQIVKIYSSNVKSFLQTNNLNSSSISRMKSLGRLVSKQTISLEELAKKPLNEEQEFALDLKELFFQEPGALYHIALSFGPSYTTIDKFYDPKLNLNLKKLNKISDIDKEWDSVSSYDSNILDLSIPYNWRVYNWDQQSNPYDLTFYMSDSNVSSTINVYSSHIGVNVKANDENKLWVTVNDIISTEPIGRTNLVAYNYQLIKIGEAITDANGFATIDCRDKIPFLVSAQDGEDITYVKVVSGTHLSTSRFDVEGSASKNGLKGFIYGERGVWRPGDTIHVSFVVEDLENRLPKEHPAIFELYNPRGQFYTKQVASSVGNGMYYFKVATQKDDPTGLWDGYVKLGGVSFYKSFSIETIKPNRLKINLDTKKTTLASPSTNYLSLNCNWLTGAVAANLSGDMELSLSRVSNPFPKFKEFSFTNQTSFNPSTLKFWDGSVDANGNATVKLEIPKYSNVPGLLKGAISVRMYEPGGERSVHSQEVVISPFKSYVGMKVENKGDNTWSYETDITHKVKLVNIDADSKPVVHNNLTYKIYKLSWSWWYDRSELSLNYIDKLKAANLIDNGQLKSGTDGYTELNFKVDYPNYGNYLIVIKDDSSGHTVFQDIYVDWPYWRGTSNKSDNKGITTFNFTTDKDSYEVGESITATLPPLKKGRAFISIEDGTKVIKREWVETKADESTTVVFKAVKEFIPNVYMYISLYQPHEQTVNDSPIRLYGVSAIKVTDKSTKLQPKVVVPKVIEPQKEFVVEVTEQSGKEMTYSLAIVDDGLLDLTSFKTPNPWSTFFAKQALGIRTWDMYDDVISALSKAFDRIYRVGGDENLEGADAKANRFNPVVKFVGPFTLKAGKTDKHKITLPMYVGSVRTMVVGAGAGAYGATEANSFVRSPLMLISSLPRVLSIGEDVWVPINIFALEDEVKNVELNIQTSSNITVVNDKKVNLKFTQIGDQLKYFHFKVGANVGVEKVTFTAKSGKFIATETIEIDVRNPNPQIAVAQNKILSAGESVTMDYNFDIINNEQKLNLTASNLPLFDLSKRLNFLYGYSHGCTEQITSRALPLLYIPFIKQLNKEEKVKIDATVNQTIRELYARQTYEGGFMYWPGGSYNSPWATQYAGMFLIRAKELGYQVNDDVLKKFINYLSSLVQTNSNDSYVQVYSLYVLALGGKANLNVMNRINENRRLSTEEQWILSAAYALAGKDKIAKELSYSAARQDSSSDSYRYYGSDIRNISFRLQTKVLLGKNDEAFKEAITLAEKMTSESYYQTQSTAYGLMAMGEFINKSSSDKLKFELTIDNGKLQSFSEDKSIYNQNLDVKQKGSVTLKNTSKGVMNLQLLEYKSVLKDLTPASAEGLEVTVKYLDFKNEGKINLSSLVEGQDFYAEVKVTNVSNMNRENIAVTHIIPTNCEIYGASNFRINRSTKAVQPASVDYQDIRDDRVLSYFSLYTGESRIIKVRLQAVYAGKFIVPAITAEVMYNPEIFGKTKADELNIAH